MNCTEFPSQQLHTHTHTQNMTLVTRTNSVLNPFNHAKWNGNECLNNKHTNKEGTVNINNELLQENKINKQFDLHSRLPSCFFFAVAFFSFVSFRSLISCMLFRIFFLNDARIGCFCFILWIELASLALNVAVKSFWKWIYQKLIGSLASTQSLCQVGVRLVVKHHVNFISWCISFKWM